MLQMKRFTEFHNLLIISSLCVCVHFYSLPMHAQDHQTLRSQLKEATEELSYYPDSVDLRLKKAALNLQLEQWQYAKDEYDQVLRSHPDNIAGLYYRAYANQQLGRYNFARLDYENLLKVVPGHFSAQLGLALLNQKDKHHTEAMNQINRLVNQFPDSAVAYAARAGMEQEQGMIELAVYDYTEALKRDADNADYLLNRVELWLKLGRKQRAKADLDRLVELGVPRPALKKWYRQL